MRSITSISPARRARRLADRRTRRRPAVVAMTLALGLVATAGLTAAMPASADEASGTVGNFVLASYATPLASTATVALKDDALDDAQDALASAEAAIAGAEAVTADIAASGLEVDIADAAVDTADLAEAVERLEIGTDARALPFLASITEDVIALQEPVEEQIAALRGSLDAAIAVQAEQEAAEQARLEAEAAAAAAASAAPAPRAAAPAPVFASGGAVGDNSPGGAQASARAMLGNYGWGDDQFGCLVSLWNKESGWNYQAYNGSSGATGIPQALPGSKMASAGADWQTNATTQVAWGLGYIAGRYGSPCSAWGHSQSVGWY